MEMKVKESLTNPEKLEQLYRQDKKKFRNQFESSKGKVKLTELIRYWQIRLQYDSDIEEMEYSEKLDILPMMICIVLVAFFIKLAGILQLSPVVTSMYEFRNSILIVFAGLVFYSLLRNSRRDLIFILGFPWIFGVIFLYLNSLPELEGDQTLKLAVFHISIVFWFLLGLARNEKKFSSRRYWLRYIRYTGDLIVFSGLILICWMIIFGLTTMLYDNLSIQYSEGLIFDLMIVSYAVTPLIASFAIERMPVVGNKVVPLIARIFNPIVLVVLVIYMVTIVQAGKNLYGEREILLIFNLILFGVLAVIIFSLSNMAERGSDKYRFLILYLLTLFSCSLNLIALSAILYRLVSFGISANRVAVVGMNLLVFCNLVKIGVRLLGVHSGRIKLEEVSLGIAGYLPVYGIWALIVALTFPVLF